MTLIDPNPIGTIRFECEVCGKGLYTTSSMSDGCSSDEDDYEGKVIAVFRCPVHGSDYKRECYNCKSRHGCDLKEDRPKRRDVGITVTWFKDAPNDRKTPPPCKFWSPRGAFYTEPICSYCRFHAQSPKSSNLDDYLNRPCLSKKSPHHGEKVKYDHPACKAWKSKYTTKHKLARYNSKITSRWKQFKQRAARPFESFADRIKCLSLRDETGDCDWCTFCSTETDECENEKSPHYKNYGSGCDLWKHCLPAWKRKWQAVKYAFTGRWID